MLSATASKKLLAQSDCVGKVYIGAHGALQHTDAHSRTYPMGEVPSAWAARVHCRIHTALRPTVQPDQNGFLLPAQVYSSQRA